MKCFTVEAILEAEARSMGRPVSLVNANVFEDDEVVTTVIYDMVYDSSIGSAPRTMHQRRVTTWVDGDPSYSAIVSTVEVPR